MAIYGIISLRGNGVVSKCGFKYLKFDPQMSLFTASEEIVYNGIVYPYYKNKIYVEIEEDDIIHETMSSITVSDCKILNCLEMNCQLCSTNSKRQIILTEDFKVAPIVARRNCGHRDKFNDVFAYNKNNYISFGKHIDFKANTNELVLNTSLKNYNEDDLWRKFEDFYPDLFRFISSNNRKKCSNLKLSQVSQSHANKSHLDRFFKNYKKDIKKIIKYDIDSYSTVDVIDLEFIRGIDMDDFSRTENYNILEIGIDRLKVVGKGFDENHFNGRETNKTLYMMIDDSSAHAITTKNGTRLRIDYNDNHNGLLFIKFTNKSLSKYI